MSQHPLSLVIRKVVDTYGHITPPLEGDNEDCLRIYGRCLIETDDKISQLAQRINHIEHHHGKEYLSQKSGESADSHTSSIHLLHEQVGDLTERFDKFENDEPGIAMKMYDVRKDVDILDNKLEELDDLGMQVLEVEQNLEKKIDQVSQDLEKRIDRVSQDLEKRIDRVSQDLEKKIEKVEDRVDEVEQSLGNRIDEARHDLEKKIDEVRHDLERKIEGLNARSRNGIAGRFHDMVAPTKLAFNASTQRMVLKTRSGPKNVGYYWRMHRSEYHHRLQAEHEFYSIDYENWASENNDLSDSEEDDDDLDIQPQRPQSLAEAIARYPERAVMALFSELGLVYSNFRNQAERQERREQDDTSEPEKRPLKKSSRVMPPTKKRNTTSTKATSSTKSFDSGSPESLMLLS